MKRIMHKMLKTAVVSALMLIATAGYAQKKRYPYVQDGKIIVCREGNDGVKSSLIHANWSSTQAGFAHDTVHNRFAAKFEVGIPDNDNDKYMDYYDAKTKCPSGWRIPTFREARLIKALSAELTGVDVTGKRIWTCTTEKRNGSTLSGIVSVSTSGGEDRLHDNQADQCYVVYVRDL